MKFFSHYPPTFPFILKAFPKTFPAKMKLASCKCPVKKKGRKSERRGEERKGKEIVKTAICRVGVPIRKPPMGTFLKARLKITDSKSPVMMTGQIFFSPDKPRFWPVKLMNIIIIFLSMEYRITLAVDRCTALSLAVVQVFAGKLVKNSFTRC